MKTSIASTLIFIQFFALVSFSACEVLASSLQELNEEEYGKAYQSLQKSSAKTNGNNESIAKLAKEYYAKGNYKEVIKIVDSILRGNDEFVDRFDLSAILTMSFDRDANTYYLGKLLLLRGMSYYKLHKYENALDDLKKYVLLDSDMQVFEVIADSNYHLGRMYEAITTLKIVYYFHGSIEERYSAAYRISMVYASLNDFDNFKEWFSIPLSHDKTTTLKAFYSDERFDKIKNSEELKPFFRQF